MSWNPNDNDPWGRKNSPPDLDDAIKQLRKMFFSGNTGGGGSKGGGASFKFNFKFFTYLTMGLLVLYVFLGEKWRKELSESTFECFAYYSNREC